ncbi:hypothetical protein Tsp_04758 [Trichinella spiralis]|uniref:hypothetical protein n=1 Tax=Trichinella spiralis TaxID=6334 RepID=UPI0001EFDBF6|nr:hypothetical protein Tsp_04758 [Trichinella spiralis]
MAKHCRSNPAPQSQQRRRNTQMTHQDCYPDKTYEISLCIGGRSHSKWCLDSGASSHMCSNKEMFLSMKNMKRTLSLANNKSTEIMGTGTANLEIPGSDGMRSVKLHNTLYVPDLRSNLLSVAKITEKGFQVIFQENAAMIANQNLGTVMVAHKEDESKTYRLWCPAERKVFKSRDVKFTGKFGNDETLYQLTAQNQEWPANDTREKENETLELQLTANESNETHQSGGTPVQNEAEQVTERRKIKVLPGKPRLVRSGRRGRPKKVYQKEEVQPVTCEDVASIAQMNDPKSAAEALSCRESKEWLEAMKHGSGRSNESLKPKVGMVISEC